MESPVHSVTQQSIQVRTGTGTGTGTGMSSHLHSYTRIERESLENTC